MLRTVANTVPKKVTFAILKQGCACTDAGQGGGESCAWKLAREAALDNATETMAIVKLVLMADMGRKIAAIIVTPTAEALSVTSLPVSVTVAGVDTFLWIDQIVPSAVSAARGTAAPTEAVPANRDTSEQGVINPAVQNAKRTHVMLQVEDVTGVKLVSTEMFAKRNVARDARNVSKIRVLVAVNAEKGMLEIIVKKLVKVKKL